MKFEIYEDAGGEFRWRLKAKNGRIVADSGEGYKTKRTVNKIIRRILNDLKWFEVKIVEVEK